MAVLRKLAEPKFGGVRTGGRSARVVDQVLTATITLLGEVGYGALRIDEVAARSGVNKTTIYRRWPTKSQLVAAALRQYHVPTPARDTGDLEHDLTEMFVESLSTADLRLTRGLMRMTLFEQHDPEVEALRGELRERAIAGRRHRFERAVERGELPAATDVLLVLNLVSTSIYTRLLADAEPPSRPLVSDIVRIVIEGARARWGAAPSPNQPRARQNLPARGAATRRR
ncbi:MAG TPA: TetR/AcrR family transcriptional regulator [Kofleriaceae bacterium]|nr:TetR/AcrR family transcriptional regulator [Kofleriaceae bacterium]